MIVSKNHYLNQILDVHPLITSYLLFFVCLVSYFTESEYLNKEFKGLLVQGNTSSGEGWIMIVGEEIEISFKEME